MKLQLSVALATTAFIVACATPYDPKQHRNIESLDRAPPSLDDLLPPRATPAPTAEAMKPAAAKPRQAPAVEADEELADVEKTRKAIENYRQILELSPNDRVVKW